MINRTTTLEILSRLSHTRLEGRLILAGSSGIHAVSEKILAMTEDVDLLIDADWVARHEETLVRELESVGFQTHPGSPTLTARDGSSVDLVGFSVQDRKDRIGGGDRIPIMVFADLSTILETAAAVVEVATGGKALAPAALTLAKLLTIRLEKGGKDKIQALLLIEEFGGDTRFCSLLRQLASCFEPDRIEDAVADAQAAVMTLSTSRHVDSQMEGYGEMQSRTQRGLEMLKKILSEDFAK